MSNKRKTRRGKPRRPMSPAMRAMADQSEAAHDQVRDVLAAAATAFGGYRQGLGRIGYGIWKRMTESMPQHCPHLDPAGPAPAFWMPWAPDRIMCADCAAAAGQAVTGTDEDRRCDWCGAVGDGVYLTAGSTHAGVADIGGTVVQVPPVLINYGLCSACHRADAEPFTPPDAGPGEELDRARKVAASMAADLGLKPGATVEGLAGAVLTLMRGADARWLQDSRPVAAPRGEVVMVPRGNVVAALAVVISAAERWVLAVPGPEPAAGLMAALASRFGPVTVYVDGALDTLLSAAGDEAVQALAEVLGAVPFEVARGDHRRQGRRAGRRAGGPAGRGHPPRRGCHQHRGQDAAGPGRRDRHGPLRAPGTWQQIPGARDQRLSRLPVPR